MGPGAGYLKYVRVGCACVVCQYSTVEIARDWAPMLQGAKLFCASKQGSKLIALLFLAMFV